MDVTTSPTRFSVLTRRVDERESICRKEGACIPIATLGNSRDALNPVELLLASVSGCLIKGAERAALATGFAYNALEVEVSAERRDIPAAITGIHYQIRVYTDESEERLQALHRAMSRQSTICNTLENSTPITGTITRFKPVPEYQ